MSDLADRLEGEDVSSWDRLEAAEKLRELKEQVADLQQELKEAQSDLQLKAQGEPIGYVYPWKSHIGSVIGTNQLEGYLPVYLAAPPLREGWIRAIDEALVCWYIGIADAADTYEAAREKLHKLISIEIDAATNPAVNGGKVLVPREATKEMRAAGYSKLTTNIEYNDQDLGNVYKAMIAAVSEEGDENLSVLRWRSREGTMNQRAKFEEWHTSVYGGDFAHTDSELKEMFAIWQAAQAQQEATVKMLRGALDYNATLLEHAPSLGIGGQNIVRQMREALNESS